MKVADHPKANRFLMALSRWRRLHSLLQRVCYRLEGGQVHSVTWRQILRDRFGVGIGPYSYGSILDPGLLARGTKVGNYCSVGVQLIVRRRNHPLDRPSLHPFFFISVLGFVDEDTITRLEDNPLEIGHDVWIGDRVTILSGCRLIGNGAVLAAGAVVTRDVAPFTVVAGIPAKVIRRRFDDAKIAEIEKTRWWDRSVEDLVAAPPFPDLFGPDRSPSCAMDPFDPSGTAT